MILKGLIYHSKQLKLYTILRVLVTLVVDNTKALTQQICFAHGGGGGGGGGGGS